MIPYGTQWINEEDITAVVDTLRSEYLTTGPKITEFEDTIKKYVGVKYAVCVSSGTAALHIACLAAGIKKGDEVITTPITFAASANCVLYCGATPVFADIDKDTYNISPKSIEEKITSRTKAIIPVHFTGQPCDMDEIHEIAKKHNLMVIEDAAHALGATYKGKMIGGLSDMTTFSFHPVKHITTCEGGMVLTNSKDLYQKLSLLRTHGITREEDGMEQNQGDWYYEQQLLGYNYRISDVACALGISQMKRISEFINKRSKIAKKYNEAFQKIKEITIPNQNIACNSSWHLYVIKVEASRRKEIFDRLRQAEIGVNVHYIPVYKHPYYQRNGYKNTCCKEAESLYNQIISIPMYPKMTVEEQNYVIYEVIQAVSNS